MTGPRTDEKGQIVIAEKKKDPAANLVALIERMKPEMLRALPRHITPDRMSRIVLTAIRTTPKLEQCTPSSFLACAMSLAQLGLEPNTPLGFAYLIPRNMENKRTGRKEMTCTLIIGYQGMMDLARRSGQVLGLRAHAVRQGDEFRYSLGAAPMIHHVPSEDPEREARPITHAYAVASIRDGGEAFAVLSLAQINARRNRSMAKDAGPWRTDFEAMCLKTAMRALFPWIPKSAEMARAEALEVAVDTGKSVVAAADEAVAALLAESAEVRAADEGSRAVHVVTEENNQFDDGKITIPPGEYTEAELSEAIAKARGPILGTPEVVPGTVAEIINEKAEIDRLCEKMVVTDSEKNAMILRHGGDFKKVLAELRENEIE